MAESSLHSYLCDESSQDSASDSEDFLEGVNGCLFNQQRASYAGVPLYASPIASPTDLSQGDHVLYLAAIVPNRPTFRSALVVSAEKGSVQIITYMRDGVRKEEAKFSDLQRLSRVQYTACRYSRKKAVQRAKGRLKMKEKCYHPLFNNSHYFVSWSKTGKQYPLSVIVQNLFYDEDKHIPLKPVLTRAPVPSLADLNPGDHVQLGNQHCLVQSVNAEAGTLAVYSCNKGKITLEEKILNHKNGGGGLEKIFRINYDQQSNFYHSGRALESAQQALEEKTKWRDASEFVTKVKCGKSYSIDERCLMFEGDESVSCTKITPHTSIDQGDHLVVKDTFDQMLSLLVHSCLDENVIVTIPNINGKGSVGELDVTHYTEVYRVNYKRCLPIDEVLRRACSPEGEELLRSCKGDTSVFVAWAKIGKQVSLNPSKVIVHQQIAQVRPTHYEKLLSVEEIQRGDHLFVPNLAYRWHFLVTERGVDPQDPMAFRTIYCLRGAIQETIENLDPDENELYRVNYPEEFPTDISIARARSFLGSRKFSPLARLWFVRWAKTGSEEGMEIDFLTNNSMPVTKSSIRCFAQLDRGDYLVKQGNLLALRHHYIVISVESPSVCTVIGAWKGKVEETVLSLDNSTYYLLNYNEGVCIPPEESIRRAQEAIGQRFTPKHMRRKFVNYMKTTVASEVDVDHLLDECLLLKREKVESVLELYPGDHIECPTLNALKQITFYDMIVVNPIDSKSCQVIHKVPTKGAFKGPQLVQEDVDLFSSGCEVFRIVYPEQIDTQEGLGDLQSAVTGNLPEGLRSDVGKLLTLATVGHPMSVQLDHNIQQLLQYSREDAVKPVSLGTKNGNGTAAPLSPSEVCTKAASHAVFKIGANAALTATRMGLISGFVPGLNLFIESPFYTRRLYKLYRKHKFDQISGSEYKRGVVKQSFTSANTVIGTTGGAIVGQLAIPIPVVGGAIGGALGAVAGHSLGSLQGWAASKLVKDEKDVTLPVMTTHVFSDIPDEKNIEKNRAQSI